MEHLGKHILPERMGPHRVRRRFMSDDRFTHIMQVGRGLLFKLINELMDGLRGQRID